MRKLTTLTVAFILPAVSPALADSHHVSFRAKAEALVTASKQSSRPQPVAEDRAEIAEQVRTDALAQAQAFANAKGGISLSATAERADQEMTGVKQREREIILEQENR